MSKKKVYISGVYYEQDAIDRKFFDQQLEVVNRRPSIRIFDKMTYLDKVNLDGSKKLSVKNLYRREKLNIELDKISEEIKIEDDIERLSASSSKDEKLRYYNNKNMREYRCYLDEYNLDGSPRFKH